jgi:hypothetical protein
MADTGELAHSRYFAPRLSCSIVESQNRRFGLFNAEHRLVGHRRYAF